MHQVSDEQTLRKLLWLRHGCSRFDLYGDDGEMQCVACKIDFKRESVEALQEKLFRPHCVFFTKDKQPAPDCTADGHYECRECGNLDPESPMLDGEKRGKGATE